MNCYTTIEAVKRKLRITGTTLDADVLAVVKAASRELDQMTGRDGVNEGFFTVSGSRTYDVPDCINRGRVQRLSINECLAVSALAEDTGADGTFATTWDASDYLLGPVNRYPKTHIEVPSYGDECFSIGPRRVRVTGTWGYGNGRNATAWVATALTGGLSSTSDTTLTLSAATGIEAGQTLLIESEQVFVSSLSGVEATVERGVNGTTAATHSAAAISLAQYPDDVALAAVWFAVDAWKRILKTGVFNERIGNYSYQMAGPEVTEVQKRRMLSRVMRHGAIPRYE